MVVGGSWLILGGGGGFAVVVGCDGDGGSDLVGWAMGSGGGGGLWVVL